MWMLFSYIFIITQFAIHMSKKIWQLELIVPKYGFPYHEKGCSLLIAVVVSAKIILHFCSLLLKTHHVLRKQCPRYRPY